MRSQDFTIIVQDKSVEFEPEEFVLSWNETANADKLPAAILRETIKLHSTLRTFDGSLMNIIGDVANFIQIATFVGVPTVAVIAQHLRADRQKRVARSDQRHQMKELEFDETTVELAGGVKIRRIVIRTKA
jgi:hypothetical protein